jgi:hypothetical protein
MKVSVDWLALLQWVLEVVISDFNPKFGYSD